MVSCSTTLFAVVLAQGNSSDLTMRKEYPDRVMETFSVILSTKVSDAVEPYNAVFISMSSKRLRTNTCCWRTGPYTTSVSEH